MATTGTKPNFPSKPCPNCGELIHARSKSHPTCGWVMNGAAPATKPASGRKPGRPRKEMTARSGSDITIQDIEAVKALVERMGAEKVRQLAQVLTR